MDLKKLLGLVLLLAALCGVSYVLQQPAPPPSTQPAPRVEPVVPVAPAPDKPRTPN